ncbi:hypothetical protein ASPWEDRAFT_376492 [Aspergillus wentii DTO 134E9]|uniref:Uncharacterized protein n=1 Tax=Aspergillus wentii DTO 134E9 TaxID=1073089 RepID=A0A1L9RX13_ASPWE|nr:uncharacterized protein ASPWEDRAFT_376492 [Aspergillus wentii DTO 134E9]OJJ39491.1 hypothetical protein ASPWEDRAFT_376492 [Aspergillus wentii DTO 134E9]
MSASNPNPNPVSRIYSSMPLILFLAIVSHGYFHKRPNPEQREIMESALLKNPATFFYRCMFHLCSE